MFLLKKTDEPDGRRGQYVAPAGSPKAYVPHRLARRFPSRAEAEENRCVENEIIVHERETL